MSLAEQIKSNLSSELISKQEDGLPSDVKQWISTGSTLLDYIISNRDNGGIPVGKITEIAGLEATGKSLFAMQIAANAQKDGALVIYMDSERGLSSDFCKRVGLDVKNKNFVYMTPNTVEDVFESMFTIFKQIDEAEKSGKMEFPYTVIIWDSVAATNTRYDFSNENPDPGATVGLKPRLLSKNVSLLLNQSGRKNVAQVFLNQLRVDIKKASMGKFVDPFVSPGGHAIPFAASARIRLKSKGKIKAKDEIVGIQTSAKVIKNRFGPPHRECQFGIYFTKGVDDTESLIDFLAKNKVFKTRNAGSQGKQYKFGKNGTEMNKVELRKKIQTDASFKETLLGELSKLMKKDLVDPDEVEQVIEEGSED